MRRIFQLQPQKINGADQRISRYAKLCRLVYGRSFNHKLYGYHNHKMIFGTFGRGFCRILSNDSECVVLFRGTREFLMDWPTNLLCWPASYSFGGQVCRVHGGFLAGLRGRRSRHRWQRTIDVLEQDLVPFLDGPTTHIAFVGHSLGGAYAVLAASIIEANHPDKISQVVTFGQPAVGGKGFKSWYSSRDLDARTTRIMHHADVVTFLPGPHFDHVGRGWWWSGRDWEADLTWSDRIKRCWKTSSICQFFTDHSAANYVEIAKHIPSRVV